MNRFGQFSGLEIALRKVTTMVDKSLGLRQIALGSRVDVDVCVGGQQLARQCQTTF